nr:glycosyltransferase [Pantoea sp. 201603H]
MKVLHAAETIKGGVATVLKQLVRAQQDDSSTFSIMCLIPADQAEELDTVEKENTVCWVRQGRNIKTMLTFAKAFIITTWQFKPDIVHLHSSFSGVIGRLCLLLLWPIIRPKIIYCPHAFSFLMETSGIKKKIYTLIERVLLPATDAIICVSEFEAREAAKNGLSNKKLFVIHNGVPARSISKRKKRQNDIEINLLFIGRFDYQKGYDLLISAIEEINNPLLKLTVIGDSVHAKAPISKLAGANYTGWLKSSQMEPYFDKADILVIPSRWEGFAMVPLEAMSYSLPIVASNATSLPEVVKHNETGFLFNSGDVKSLAGTLARLHEFDLEEMGMKGNVFFLENFTSCAMIAKTHELYERIIKK